VTPLCLKIAVEEIAAHAGAIPYELTCAVSPRVQHEVR
jgi:alanine racemase